MVGDIGRQCRKMTRVTRRKFGPASRTRRTFQLFSMFSLAVEQQRHNFGKDTHNQIQLFYTYHTSLL